MSIFSKLADSLGGSVLGTIKDTVMAYLPPNMSDKEKSAIAIEVQKGVDKAKADLTSKLVEIDSLYLNDIQNARANNKHSKMPAVICLALTAGMFLFVGALLFITIPEANLRMIDMVFGSYLTAWLGSINYWVGTTRSSAEKSKQQLIEVSKPMAK